MTEFTDLEIDGDVSSMEEDEAKETLVDFMDAHADNREAYDELQTEFRDEVEELEDEKDSLEERVSEFKERRAEKASEFVNIPESLVAERFSFDEIEQIIEEGEEFSEAEEDEESEEEEPERLTEFSEKPEKGQTPGEDRDPQKRERAESLLSGKGFPTGN